MSESDIGKPVIPTSDYQKKPPLCSITTGGADGIWTRDLYAASVAFSQLNYGPVASFAIAHYAPHRGSAPSDGKLKDKPLKNLTLSCQPRSLSKKKEDISLALLKA